MGPGNVQGVVNVALASVSALPLVFDHKLNDDDDDKVTCCTVTVSGRYDESSTSHHIRQYL